VHKTKLRLTLTTTRRSLLAALAITGTNPN
jgi:hypothetical protein